MKTKVTIELSKDVPEEAFERLLKIDARQWAGLEKEVQAEIEHLTVTRHRKGGSTTAEIYRPNPGFAVTSRQYNNHGQDYDLTLFFDVETQAEIVRVMQELDEQMICWEDHERIVRVKEPGMPPDFFGAGGFSAEFVSVRDASGTVLDPDPDLVDFFS